jgi:hypothetical protein
MSNIDFLRVLIQYSASFADEKWSDPATRHGGAWGERRYGSYSFLTSALDRGELSASRPGHALSPGKGPPVPIVQEGGWAPEPVWTQRLEEKSSAPVGDQTPVVQPVVRHYTAWATSAPSQMRASPNYGISRTYS